MYLLHQGESQLKKLVSLAALTFVLACSEESKFKAGVGTKDVEPAKPVPVLVEKSIQLNTVSTQVPIDMIWVVDNSGSMKELIAQVRTNINVFVDAVGEKTDLQLSILSLEDNAPSMFGLKIESSSGAKDFLQVKSAVGSWNLLSAFTAASCEANKSKFSTNNLPTSGNVSIIENICGTPISAKSQDDHLVPAFAGTLATRLRPTAQKVIVFVTDDNTRGGIDSSNFFKTAGLDQKRTHIYAFSGQEGGGCQVSAVGKTYQELAAATGGETFNICEKDWKNNFDKLTSNVKKITANVFEVDAAVSEKSIKAVKVGSKTLAKEQYTVANGQLTIKDSSVLEEGDVVTVEYEVEELQIPKPVKAKN